MRTCRSPVRIAGTLLAAAVMLAGPALAVEPGEKLADPKLEQRARALSAELRCLVCQNQSIDDSNAELARDLRIVVRERIAAGDSDREVMDFVVERYGDFVLLRPPFKPSTLLLWFAPLLVLVGAVAFAFFGWRRSRQTSFSPTSADALTAEDRAKVDRLLNG